MEDILKHPYVILIALASVGISSLVNIKLASDPNARPDPFTGTQGVELERQLRAEIMDIRSEFREHRRDYDNHIKWGRRESIKTSETIAEHGAHIKELMSHHKSHHKSND